ncbi:MAG: AAA family ATPase, partial [Thermomicrobiales bacterium]
MKTLPEALLFCRTHGITPRRENGRIILDNVPTGIKVPQNLTALLNTHEGDFPATNAANAEALPTYDSEGRSLAALMEETFVPRRENVPGIIVQGVSLLASKAKIGKTWFVLGTALALASGGVALGVFPVEKTGVLLLSLEDGPQRLQDRFSLLLDDKPAPDGLTIFTEWPRLDAGGGADLDAYLTNHPDVKVVFIDTLAKIRPMRRKGGDLYQEDYHVGEVLKEICEKHCVAIVLVYHTRKARADDPLDEIRDTMGLTGGVDNCLILRRERGSADAVLYVTGRDIAEEKGFALKWDTPTAQWIVAGDASEYAVSTARKQVLDTLEGAPDGLTPTAVARQLGKPLSAVKKLMWTMSKDDLLTVTDGRYQKRGNPGNPVTHREKTLATQANPTDDTVTSRLPN